MTTNQTHDDASIDLLARRAGAEVRQPAPAGIITAVRRARRRQQATRGVIGVTGALVAVAALVLANKQTQPDFEIVDPATPIVNPTAAPPPGTIAGVPPDSTLPGEPANTPVPGVVTPSSDLASELANFQVASLAFADPLNGWQLSVVDGTGIVRRTVDGGISWQNAGTVPGPIESTSSLSFSTARDGYLINKPRFVTAEAASTLFVTHDAGATWQPSQTPGSVMQIIGGPDEDLAIASQCTDSATGACPVGLLASPDHGDTWTIRYTPVAVASRVSTLRTENALFVTGTGGDQAVLSRSADNGASWTNLDSPCNDAVDTMIDADNSNTLWMACAGEPESGSQPKLIARSDDDGDNWTVMANSGVDGGSTLGSIGTNGYLVGLGVNAGDYAYIAVDRTTMMVTDDGGATWDSLNGFPTEVTFAAIHFLNMDDAWAAITSQTDPAASGIYRTTDGGRNWLLSDPTVDGTPSSDENGDGMPDGVYVFTDNTYSSQNVLDPTTLEIRETRPAMFDNSPESPTEATSASGLFTYTTTVYGEVEQDECRQERTAVAGGPATGLPEWKSGLTLSADGKVGAIVSGTCPAGQSYDESLRPTKPFDIEVSLFDADHPEQPARSVTSVDATTESCCGITLSADGSFLMVTTGTYFAGEGYFSAKVRIYDTTTGQVVVDHNADTVFDMPHGECSTWPGEPRFAGTSSVAYAALCSDAIYVVIRDLVTGETIDVANPEYAGRTYETMVGAGLTVDPATYSTPSQAWFILCAERETPQGDGSIVINAPGSNPCWLGHGGDALRPIPAPGPTGASFTPLA